MTVKADKKLTIEEGEVLYLARMDLNTVQFVEPGEVRE